MYFNEYGKRENPTLVLLHGAGATDEFCRQYTFEDEFHLIVPHLHGSGRSVTEIYEPNKAAAEVTEIIRALNKPKVMLMGHSLGGELAVKLVCEHEELFSRAVFLSAWVCSAPITVNRYARMAAYMYGALKSRMLLKWQAKYWGYNEQQTEFFMDYARRIGPEQAQAWFKNRVFLDELTGYKDVKIPMLAICGSRETAEMRHSLAELGKRNANCRTVEIPGVDHDFLMRAADKLNPLLAEFFTPASRG